MYFRYGVIPIMFLFKIVSENSIQRSWQPGNENITISLSKQGYKPLSAWFYFNVTNWEITVHFLSGKFPSQVHIFCSYKYLYASHIYYLYALQILHNP